MSRPDSRRMPAEQRALVVGSLYADAQRLDWEHLPINQRTEQYDRWVSTPSIGGLLIEFMSAETARSWIKDGPMKEYARARQGAGRYAAFGAKPAVTPEQIIRRALGPEADLIPDTFGVKPMHCRAAVEDGESYVAWGEGKNFRYLVWACLNFLAERPSTAAHIVVTETMTDPTTAAEKRHHAAIASRCQLGLSYHRLAASDGEGERAL